ncbi:MAG: hypothetical protein RBR05_00010 [Candidatus Methanomethylophilaceae archaeon]|jgi:hypothetical protein|nr:hypothetical protein [Candidatus Methanomethylophilaceae archaeon]MDD3378762.1 hypothetical protein [Candidatus Methanomethylophilaceae archaeon]MDY0223769.1 hypothetical protein [Candidatus Methanomethylophilaceae archaeon]
MLDDVVPLIWEIMGDDRITTKEASERLESLFNYRCPDDLAKTMIKLKKVGLIKGEVSMEKGGWIWWVDEECRNHNKDQKASES